MIFRYSPTLIWLRSWAHMVKVRLSRASVDARGFQFSGDLPRGRATRRLPELRRCRLPVEGVFARAVLLQMCQPRDRLFHAGPVAGRHPPQRDRRSLEMLDQSTRRP